MGGPPQLMPPQGFDPMGGPPLHICFRALVVNLKACLMILISVAIKTFTICSEICAISINYHAMKKAFLQYFCAKLSLCFLSLQISKMWFQSLFTIILFLKICVCIFVNTCQNCVFQ